MFDHYFVSTICTAIFVRMVNIPLYKMHNMSCCMKCGGGSLGWFHYQIFVSEIINRGISSEVHNLNEV